MSDEAADGAASSGTTYDVVVIGAGGAGLRAAIAAHEAGARDRDRLQVAARQGAHGDGRGRHRRGHGQPLARGQLGGALPRHHAWREDAQQLADGPAARPGGARAGARARGLGRAVRPHRGRADLPARLRRPPLRPARPRRRPHRPGDDPHPPAARGRSSASTCSWSARSPTCSRTATARSPAPSATGARPAASSPSRRRRSILATGGIGKSFKVTSNSWEYTGDGHALALRAGADADQHGVRAVPPDRHGLAAVGEGAAGHRVGARRRRHPARTPRASGSCSTTSRSSSRRRRPTPRRRPTAGTTTRRTTAGRPSCCRVTRSPGRSTPRSRPAAGSPHGGIFLDIASRRDAGVHPQAAAVDVPPVQGAGRRRHHRGADGDRPDLPLRDGRRRGRRRHRAEPRAPACTPSASAPAACTAPTGSAATRSPTCWCSAGAPARPRRRTPPASGAAPRSSTEDDVRAGAVERARAVRASTGGENPYTIQQDLQQTMNDLVGIIRTAEELERSLDGDREAQGAGAARSSSRATGSTTPAGTSRSTCATCCWSRSDREGGARARGVARRPHPRRLPGTERGVGRQEPRASARRRRHGRRPRPSSRCRSMPDELKTFFEERED